MKTLDTKSGGPPVTWILLAGAPGTGKSTLARRLSAALGPSAILDKDRVREALFPGTMTDYSAEQDALCMKAILEAATYLSQHHRARYIFLDGRTFSRTTHIDEVLSAASRAGAQWRILHLTCSDGVAEARLQAPNTDHPARNRDMALYRRVKASFEPIHHPKLDLDTSTGIEDLLPRALAYIPS
jgi:predicted kinase